MQPLPIFFRRWRYLFLLASLLTLLVIEPIATSVGILGSLSDALFVATMMVLVLALAEDKVWRIVALILCVPSAARIDWRSLSLRDGADVSLSVGHAVGAFFFVAVIGRIVGSLFVSKSLSLDSVFGAMCGYLLLGVAWALTYSTLYAANPESFQFSEAIRAHLQQTEYSKYVFIYYSYVTLTTVGYGDVTPISIPARTLSWTEAVAGQLYLAVLIAGLISAIVAKNATNRRP